MAYKTSAQTQERKDLKKRHLIETAVRVISEQGYHATTVKHIVDAADLSVGTFYFYFKSKEELFESLYEILVDELYHSLTNSLNKLTFEFEKGFGMGLSIGYILSQIRYNPSLAHIMLIEAVGLNDTFELKRASVMEKYTDVISAHFIELSAQNNMSLPEGTLHIFSVCFMGTLYNVVMNWLQTGAKSDLMEAAYGLSLYNLRAIAPHIEYDEAIVRRGVETAWSQQPILDPNTHLFKSKETTS